MDQAFDEILASIAKANRERDAMRRELDGSNTLKYQLLEVGAETFQLAKQTAMGWAVLALSSPAVVAVEGRFLPLVLLAKVALSGLNRAPEAAPASTPNPELSELLLELSKLREEMSALAKTSKETARPSPIKPPTVQRLPPPPPPPQQQLPFNADMLVKQRKCAKPVVPSKPAPPVASPNSIQGMLQRAIQEKFKNAPGSHRRRQESDSASSEDEEEDENGSFLVEKRAMEDECERATRRPPVPNRTFKTKSNSARLGKSPVKSNINL